MPKTSISKDLIRLPYNSTGAMTASDIKLSPSEDIAIRTDLDTRVQLNPTNPQTGGIKLTNSGQLSIELGSSNGGAQKFSIIVSPSWLTGSLHIYDLTGDASVVSIKNLKVGLGTGSVEPTEKLQVAGHIDLTKNQIKNICIHNVTSDARPASPNVGQMIFETDTKKMLKWDGTDWTEMGGGGGGQIIQNYATFDATNGQTVFNLPFTYTPGGNTLQVFCDGVLKRITDDYAETNNNTVTFVSGRSLNEKVTFRVVLTTSSTATTRYVQSFISQTSVVVNHNLENYPIVQVIDNSGNVIIPDSIVNNSTNQCTITFGSSETGTIICIVGSSGTATATNALTIKAKSATGGLSAFNVVFKNSTADEYGKANASSVSTMPACGIILTDLSAGSIGDMVVLGEVTNPSWTWTPGGDIFVNTVDGSLTQTAPTGAGKVVQIVGYAKTVTTAVFTFDRFRTVLG